VGAERIGRLLGGRNPTRSPFPTPPSLSLVGFFFPLLQPMLGMVGQPAIRQQSPVWSKYSAEM
jgi:hypothetical protein